MEELLVTKRPGTRGKGRWGGGGGGGRRGRQCLCSSEACEGQSSV